MYVTFVHPHFDVVALYIFDSTDIVIVNIIAAYLLGSSCGYQQACDKSYCHLFWKKRRNNYQYTVVLDYSTKMNITLAYFSSFVPFLIQVGLCQVCLLQACSYSRFRLNCRTTPVHAVNLDS